MPRIEGDENDNRLTGDHRSDRIFGFGGRDTLEGGLDGDDRLYGGAGDDTIWAAGRGETVAFGGEGNDIIRSGPEGDDRLDGGTGDDVVGLEYSGDPAIDRGSSIVIGGDGFDELAVRIYDGSSETVLSLSGELTINGVVRASASGFESASFYADAGAHKVTATEGADFIWTSGGLDDTLIGGAGDDTIQGDEGRDRIDAGDGDDEVILGDVRGDRVELGVGDDRLEVSHDADEGGAAGLYDGGEGHDAIDFDLSALHEDVAFDGETVTVDGKTLAVLTGFESISIEGSLLTGLSGDDSLYGAQVDDDTETDRLVGRGGDDLLMGYGGRNILIGGAGDDTLETVAYGRRDTLDGGAGEDRLELDYAYKAIIMTGDLQSGVTVSHGGATTVLGRGFESVKVFGSSGDDVLIGGAGDDFIEVGEGADVLSTFDGDDHVFVRLDEVADQIDLGAGTDQLNLTFVGGERVVMREGAGGMAVTLGGSASANIAGAERFFVWAGGGNDRLLGGDLSDTLWGGGGRDILLGRGGDDVFRAETGDYSSINGGGGEDRLELDSRNGSNSPIITTIAADGAITITVGGRVAVEARSVEAVDLTGRAGDDLLLGLSLDDVLRGGDGTDTLDGGAGDDLLIASDSGFYRGGAGDDTLSLVDLYEFEDRFVGVDLTLDRGAATIESLAGEIRLTGVENITGTDRADTITGDARDNVIDGGAGGLDILDGGAGVDTLSYAESQGVTVNLADGSALEIGGYVRPIFWSEQVRGFENVIGSTANDRIAGDDGDNRIEAGRGADELAGGGGADTFVFAAGDTNASAFGVLFTSDFDYVTDFSSAEGDKIDLSAMAAAIDAGGELAFVGEAAFSGAARSAI